MDPLAGDQPATAVVQFGDQRVEERHGVELHLAGQPHPARERERHVEAIDPLDTEAGGLGRLELGPRRGRPRSVCA